MTIGGWSRSLAGQFTLLLAGALVVANLVALVILGADHAREVRDARRGAEIERIAALVPALDAVSPARREAVVRSASTRVLLLSVDSNALVARPGDTMMEQRLARTLAAALEKPQAAVRVRIAADGRGMHARLRQRAAGQGRATALALSVALADGAWLNARQLAQDPPRPRPGGAVMLTLLLSLLAVLGVGLWFVRRITRPIRALGAAAERAGRGDRSALVPVEGASELRRAAAAFNAMQVEIARFDAERARTVAAVGHDLRTPITSLRIRAEMLDEEVRDPMVRTLEEMRVMADGLLAWGRSEADAEAAEPLDLAALLRELCDPQTPDPRPGGAARVPCEGPDELWIRGRPVALRRGFSNVIDTARRYGSGGTLRLAAAEGSAVVTLEDTGPGIPEERLAAMFEPFTRGEVSRSADTGGAGLGLSIARTIFRAHGGEITAGNRAPRGLRITVTLPSGPR